MSGVLPSLAIHVIMACAGTTHITVILERLEVLIFCHVSGKNVCHCTSVALCDTRHRLPRGSDVMHISELVGDKCATVYH
jgi:hypothetical protein